MPENAHKPRTDAMIDGPQFAAMQPTAVGDVALPENTILDSAAYDPTSSDEDHV